MKVDMNTKTYTVPNEDAVFENGVLVKSGT